MTPPDPTRVPVAIVGLGRAGWNLHFQPLLRNPDFQIVAVADPDRNRCAEAARLADCRTFSSLREALPGCPAALVVIATPSATHYADAVQVLDSGRHCLLEKPMAMSFGEAQCLVSLARRKKVRLFVHHNHLHKAEFHHLKGVVDSGILGPLFHLRAFWGGYARRWDWQTLRKNGGGQLNNTCPHLFSMVLPLLGARVTHVYADLRNIKDAGDAEDHVHVVARAENGITADMIVSSACAAGAPKWMLFGRAGALIGDGTVSRLRYFDESGIPPVTVIDAAAPGRRYLTEELPWQEKEIHVETAEGGDSFHQNVGDVLIRDAAQTVTAESAAEVVRVMEMARLAAEQIAEASSIKKPEPESPVHGLELDRSYHPGETAIRPRRDSDTYQSK